MRKQVMVLVDSEEGYAERFKDFVNRKKTSPYQLRAFSDPGLMNAYFQMHRAEVLLISEADYGKEKLKAEVPVRILLSDKCHGRSGEELPTIWKYQPVSAILKEVDQIVQKTLKQMSERKGEIWKPPSRIIGVFSTAGRCGKTAFAMALALKLGSKRSVLYMNMDSYSGLTKLGGFYFHQYFDDLAYHLLSGSPGLCSMLQAIVIETAGISILPPARDPSVYLQISNALWQKLMRTVREESQYEIIVLDMGYMPLLYPSLLDECDLLYMPAADDTHSAITRTEYLERLTELDPDLASGIRFLSVSEIFGEQSGQGEDGDWLRFVLSGPPAQLAEKVIGEEQLWT